MTFTTEQKEWLYALQRPWPLVAAPLDILAQQLNTTSARLVAFIEQLRTAGLVRRIGAVFDARKLGYRSCLYAIRANQPESLQTAAEVVVAQPGVTHAYIRGWDPTYRHATLSSEDYADYPNLWYTLSAPKALFEKAEEPLKRFAPIPFPALKRYKIDVVFDLRTRNRDERTEYCSQQATDEQSIFTAEQQALVRRYQDDTIDVTQPFVEADLPQLRTWQANGTLRRFGLLLYHRVSGFSANGMCCWSVPQTDTDTFGRRLANSPEVTHCYARPSHSTFPFTLYAMIHKTSYAEAMATFDYLSETCGLTSVPRKIFFSTHEYKKSSLRFFI